MISIHAHIQGEQPGPHQRVNLFSGPDAEHRALVGGLLMLPEEAAELIARIDAAEIEQATTPEVAAHVLWHYGATGGMEPGSFEQHLIATIASADREDTLRLAAVYPGYTQAVHWAANHPGGIRLLQQVAGHLLITPGDGA